MSKRKESSQKSPPQNSTDLGSYSLCWRVRLLGPHSDLALLLSSGCQVSLQVCCAFQCSQCNAGVSSWVRLTTVDRLSAREKYHRANSSVCCVTPANNFSSLGFGIQADFPLTLMNVGRTCRSALPRHSSLSSPGPLGGCAVSVILHMLEFREGAKCEDGQRKEGRT